MCCRDVCGVCVLQIVQGGDVCYEVYCVAGRCVEVWCVAGRCVEVWCVARCVCVLKWGVLQVGVCVEVGCVARCVCVLKWGVLQGGVCVEVWCVAGIHVYVEVCQSHVAWKRVC